MKKISKSKEAGNRVKLQFTEGKLLLFKRKDVKQIWQKSKNGQSWVVAIRVWYIILKIYDNSKNKQ